jgi:4-amino-4-deoxy-L-arabinose transferase-like glycosyltransferase
MYPLTARPRPRLWLYAFAAALCAATVMLLVSTTDEIGWSCDEVYYFSSAEIITDWFQGLTGTIKTPGLSFVLSRKIVDEYWLWDIEHNPHPPLYKIFSAATLAFFKDQLGSFAAFRLSSQIQCGLLLAALFICLAGSRGLAAGLCGAACLVLMPRVFGHAHFGTTELPLMTLWFLCVCAFWRGRAQAVFSVLLAILWGMALATKFTAVLIPAPLVLWALVYRDRASLRNFILMLLVAPLVAIALNPGWWHDPIAKIGAYVATSLSRDEHIPIPTLYFGQALPFRPHWSYAPVMTALTIPLSTLVLFLIGTGRLAFKTDERSYDLLMFMTIPVLLLIVMLTNAPLHDGVRQFIYIMPFIAYCAGTGFAVLTGSLERLIPITALRVSITASLLLAAVAYPALETARSHPFELSYYNRLIGGLPGAHRRGMEVTYWYEALNDDMLSVINRTVPPGALVSSFPVASHYFKFLQEKGKIRSDITFIMPDIRASVSRSGQHIKFSTQQPDYLVLVCRFGMFDDFYWRMFRKSTPVFTVKHEGVPLAALYRWKDVRF